MKRLMALALLSFCPALHGQGCLPEDCGPERHRPVCDYTDGVNEMAWKIQNPSGPKDWWNSYKGTECQGMKIDAIVADYYETHGVQGTHRVLGIYPDLGGGAPDTSAAIAFCADPIVPANDGLSDDNYYSIPVTKLGSTAIHVASSYVPGDSHCWMSSDTTSFQGRSFFTSNGYATGANPITTEIDLYLASPHEGKVGGLLINGSTHASVQQNDCLCIDFFGPVENTRFALYLCVGGNPVQQLLPSSFTVTDHPVFGGSCPGSWQFCTTLNCNTPTATNIEFCTIWADQTEPKPNGKARLKLGCSAFLDILPDPRCGIEDCFGQKDDCFLDAQLWRVTNPAGPSDWFNVNHGVPPSGVSSLDSVALSSHDFCGIGPCWAEVGIYRSDLLLDPSGKTPKVSEPLARVNGSSACMPVGASDGSCPLTVYDTPDWPVDSRAADGIHVAARWPAGDSCIWLGSDTDGLDSPCGIPIPSNGCYSLFTSTSYNSVAMPFTGANWMMQIDWH